MGATNERTKPESVSETSRVLFVYYSFSGQTLGLLNHLANGLRSEDVQVNFVKLKPLIPLRFPIGSYRRTFKMMLTTFFRQRIPVADLEPEAWESYDLVILAGPTWSYNPSGPVLDFLDRFGEKILRNQTVLPLISCRGYWRMHWVGLKMLLASCGAHVTNRIVFSHPMPEPWRTIGVFLKITGKGPERSPLLRKFYKRYGHTKSQLEEAEIFGVQIGKLLKEGKTLSELDMHTKVRNH